MMNTSAMVGLMKGNFYRKNISDWLDDDPGGLQQDPIHKQESEVQTEKQ